MRVLTRMDLSGGFGSHAVNNTQARKTETEAHATSADMSVKGRHFELKEKMLLDGAAGRNEGHGITTPSGVRGTHAKRMNDCICEKTKQLYY